MNARKICDSKAAAVSDLVRMWAVAFVQWLSSSAQVGGSLWVLRCRRPLTGGGRRGVQQSQQVLDEILGVGTPFAVGRQVAVDGQLRGAVGQ